MGEPIRLICASGWLRRLRRVESCRAVATTFKVSVASVVKWSQRFRATGSAAANQVGGVRPFALAGERDWLLARSGRAPDVTLRALGRSLPGAGSR